MTQMNYTIEILGFYSDTVIGASALIFCRSNVNHIAIVVSDVGISLSFYINVIGMKQINRPDFDRHGAW